MNTMETYDVIVNQPVVIDNVSFTFDIFYVSLNFRFPHLTRLLYGP